MRIMAAVVAPRKHLVCRGKGLGSANPPPFGGSNGLDSLSQASGSPSSAWGSGMIAT